jgi:guanylate kinase
MARGRLFVLSAPSGSGKSSLVREVLASTPGLRFSVSYTTRPIRAGEADGREYHFVSDDEFDRMVAAGGFLEWAGVFGQRYGTGREATEEVLAAGDDLLLDIDVQGARQVRNSGVGAVFIFVLPPDFSTLEHRLRSRGSESDAQLGQRLRKARREAEEYASYDYMLVNDDLARCADALRCVLIAERLRVSRAGGEAERILATFPPS